MIPIDGFNDELTKYVTWYEYQNIRRQTRTYERTQ